MYAVQKRGGQPIPVTTPESDFFFPCSDAGGLYFSSARHLALAEKATFYGSPEYISVVVILIISTI